MASQRQHAHTAVVAEALRVHGGELRAFVHARVPSAEVDDILQLAAMRAVERAQQLDHPDRVLPWLYRLHRNIITDTARTRASRARLVDPTAEPPEVATAKVDSSCACSVRQAQSLHPPYASILALVDLGDATLAEAATALGISVNNATVRLHRARRSLRDRMREHCGVASLMECANCRCTYDGCCD
ncbi:MAG: sigma-70 family RNA polymerase sigma factor [Myxococcota bacterium]